jgi:adenine-specific DNA-methyltransferase
MKSQIGDAARQLRARQTQSEAVLWEALRDRRLDGLKFRRQQPFGPFVVDFYCVALRLVIEIDGAVHHDPAQIVRDAERQEVLEALDLRMLRVSAMLVERDLPACIAAVREYISALPSEAPLSPRGRGAGGEGLRATTGATKARRPNA